MEFEEEVVRMLDLTILENCINCLQKKPSSKWHKGTREDNTTFTLGNRTYALDIQKFFQNMDQCGFYDPHYAENIQKLRHKKVQDLTLNDCCTWLTYIVQGENICDGHIQFYVENGFLLNLLRHFVKLLV